MRDKPLLEHSLSQGEARQLSLAEEENFLSFYITGNKTKWVWESIEIIVVTNLVKFGEIVRRRGCGSAEEKLTEPG